MIESNLSSNKRFVLLLLAICTCFQQLAAQDQMVIDKVIASVGNEIVLLSEVQA